MCPRFSQRYSWEEMRAFFDLIDVVLKVYPRFNIHPTDQIPVICNGEEGREAVMAVWWLIPPWADKPNPKFPMFNARGESLLDRKAFAEPVQSKRCLIPMTGWFEWHREGSKSQPYYFTLKSEEQFAVAGLWQVSRKAETPITSCTMVTTEGNPLIAEYHAKNRMPAVLSREDWDAWLDTDSVDAELALQRIRSWPEEDITAYAVDGRELAKKMGESPACIAPLVEKPDRG